MSADELPTAAQEDQYGFAKRRIDRVQRVDLIEVVTAEGSGSGDDFVRMVARYYTLDGRLVAVGGASS